MPSFGIFPDGDAAGRSRALALVMVTFGRETRPITTLLACLSWVVVGGGGEGPLRGEDRGGVEGKREAERIGESWGWGGWSWGTGKEGGGG